MSFEKTSHLSTCTAALLAVLALAPASAHATTLVYKDLDQLIRQSDGVIVGTVSLVAARRDPLGGIFTFVVLEDLEILDGRFDGVELVLRQLGGESDGEVQEVVGAPRFTEGERVLVFVEDNGRRMVPVTGWTQGVFRLRPDESGAARVEDHDGNRVLAVRGATLEKEHRFGGEAAIVTPELGSPGIPDDGSNDGPALRFEPDQPAGEAMTLERFTAEIRQRLAATGKPARSIASLSLFELGEVSPPEQRDDVPGLAAERLGDSERDEAEPEPERP